MNEKLNLVEDALLMAKKLNNATDADAQNRNKVDAYLGNAMAILDQAQQSVAPIGVELAEVRKWDWHELDMVTGPGASQFVKVSDLEKLVALPQTEKGEGWVSVTAKVKEDVPFECVYFDRIAKETRPLLSYGLKHRGKWFAFNGNNAWDKEDYTELWAVNHPEFVRQLPSPPQDAGKVKP